jgi:arsenate reductase (glutaredoxin)
MPAWFSISRLLLGYHLGNNWWYYLAEMGELSIYFNPRCSKCRTAQGLLAERNVDAHVIEYLKAPPTVPELRVLMGQLGFSDPRQMMRTGEDIYATLELADQSGDALLEAITDHPVLLERPIVVRDGRAVIARPPELLLELLDP